VRDPSGELVVKAIERERAEERGGNALAKHVRGVIHGRTIELAEDPGVADGQQVEISIKTIPIPRPWGEGILRTVAALVDDPE
jgi:hypothetical protein